MVHFTLYNYNNINLIEKKEAQINNERSSKLQFDNNRMEILRKRDIEEFKN